MIDLDILRECGTTNNRLREFFTAAPPTTDQAATMSEADRARRDQDIERRKTFEERLASWLQEHVMFSLENHAMYSAVDLAWDSMPVQKNIIPLMQYAAGRIDIRTATKALEAVPNGDQYAKRNAKGEIIGIDLPKFCEVNVNLVRSVISRRVAAQSQKYNNLWPFFKYEARANTQTGRLKGDLTSQRMDIMADQYDYRHFQTQLTRDMFLYPNGTVAFPRASWEREVQWEKAPLAAEFKQDGKIAKRARVVKEGVCWTAPHPSRIFYDNNHPISSLNCDIGCEYVGFWDVCRYREIKDNPAYFNRDAVGWSADTAAFFTSYTSYFNQYYDVINPPAAAEDPATTNDRKANVGLYTGEMDDTSTFFTHFWVKVKPVEWGWGTYPYPVWVHLKVAGDCTVVYADIMPSSPGAVCAFNCSDGRLLNISMAHELMPLQDQLTNLFSQLLETAKADLFSVGVLNTDIFPDTPEGRAVRDEFKKVLRGQNYYASMQVLEAIFAKLHDLGISTTADNIFKVVRSAPNTALNAIFEAITRVILLADRLMVMSSQEQGQPAPREISATESNMISGATESVYSFISDSLDECRSAMKRICYESWVACGEDICSLPVSARYPQGIIERAGFKVVDEDGDSAGLGDRLVRGSKLNLVHDYVFTSRDGSERASSSVSADVLVRLLQAIGGLHPAAQNAVLSAMGKEKLFEIMNTIFRLADAGVDLKLEVKPGEDDGLLLEDDQQVMGIIQQLAEAVKTNAVDLAQIKQALGGPTGPPQQ